jgi:EKC/KEOPS complex subunit CGI121/TPRKB
MIARVHYSHLPTDFSVVHVGLIKGVTNAVELRSRIVAAAAMEGPEGDAAREAVNFAFIDARLVCTAASSAS